MRIDLSRLKDVLHVIARVESQSPQGEPIKVMAKNLTTPGTIEPEVWIMSGLVLSLVTQIVSVSLQQRHADKLDINTKD